MATREPDPVMKKARKLFEQSGKSLDELGVAMGSTGETAKKYAWQFLNRVDDPRISTLRRFARAMGVAMKDLVCTKSEHFGQCEQGGSIMPKSRRTTHRSNSGKKLYAKRTKSGRFEDIQSYKRAHGADIKRRSKAELSKRKK